MYKEYDPEILKKLQQTELGILKKFIEICDKHDLKYFAIAGTALGAVRHKGFIPWDDDIDIGLLKESYNKFLQVAEQELKYTIFELTSAQEDSNSPFLIHSMKIKGTKNIPEYHQYDIPDCMGIGIDIFSFNNVSEDLKIRKKQFASAWFWQKLFIIRWVPFPPLPVHGVIGKCVHVICFLMHWVMRIFHISKKWISQKYYKQTTSFTGESSLYTIFSSTSVSDYLLEYDDIFPLKQLEFEDIMLNVPNRYDKMLRQAYGDYMELPPVDKRKNHVPFILEFPK